MDTNSFSPISGGFTAFGNKGDMDRLKKRDEILEQFKKEKGIDNPERLPMPEFIAFRKELFERYKEAGV